ncbi:kinetochore scaffold 1 isoform X2, partial [Silurus asotus]
ADSDDMEITQSQPVVPETKYAGGPFSNLSKVSSFLSSTTADRMMMDTTQTGNITRYAYADSKSEQGKRNVTPATNSVLQDQSDFMDLTCHASTGILSTHPEDSVFTGGSKMALIAKHISTTNSKPLASFMLQSSDPSDVKRADLFKSELSQSHMVDDMEMTQCHTVCDMEMTQHTVCNMEMTQHTVCNMERTLCQTVETKNCEDYKPSERSKKRLSIMSPSCGPEAMTHEHTGHMELSRSSFLKRSKTENSVGPTAQRSLNQDLLFQQGTISAVPFIHDDMDLTGCKTITINPKTRFTSGAGNRVDIPKEETSDKSGMDLAKGQTTENKSYKPSSSSNINEYVPLNSTVTNMESCEEDCNMEMTRAFTVPLEDQYNVALNQEQIARETVEPVPVYTDQTIKELDHTLQISNTTVSCTKNSGCVLESDIDTLREEHSSSVISRRRSMADLHKKIKRISQYISEPDEMLPGSVTAPLIHFSVEKDSEIDALQPSMETQLLENRTSSAHKECTTPFNLKNSLMARLSVGAIVPKFPTRVRSASPNETEPKSPVDLQGVQLQTCVGADIQNESYESDIMDEVLAEADFSGSLVSNLSKMKEQDIIPEVHLSQDAIAYDHMESVMHRSQSEKTPPEVKDATVKITSEKMWDSTCAAQKVQARVKIPDDTNSSSNSTMMKCEGISELTLRNSQLDSQIEGTLDHEFDFYKKLEEGSVTVNEFLTHFGAKFVIHRSRPSSVPDNLRAAQSYTTEELLTEKYIHRPKQKVYETDCQQLAETVEGFKIQMADQEKPLRIINPSLHKDICVFSKEQLQQFGAKLKERRVYFRKRSKALSHQMKENLYSELLKTTREAKRRLMSKIEETTEMLKDLDGCINDLESELIGMNHIAMEDQPSLTRLGPVLKAKQEQLDALNSEVTEKENQICKLELQAQSLEDTRDKVQVETRELKCHAGNLNSLNEWRVFPGNKNGLVFTFLHDTVQLEVKHKHAAGKECVQDQDVDIAFKFLLNAESSQPSAVMIHKLLTEKINSQTTWMQKYSTTQSIPMLLHDVSLVVSRLRLLGEEIHRLEKWGGLRLGILHITCVDTQVDVVFSSVRAFVKFELSLAVTPDYPFSSLQLQKFQNHIGDTSLEQIRDIVSSVRPSKFYLTTVLKRIHSNLL